MEIKTIFDQQYEVSLKPQQGLPPKEDFEGLLDYVIERGWSYRTAERVFESMTKLLRFASGKNIVN